MQEEEGREDRLTLLPVPISLKGIRVANSRIGSGQIRGELNQDDADGHAKWMGKGHTGQLSIKTIGDRGSWEREEVVLPRVFNAKWPSPEDMHAVALYLGMCGYIIYIYVYIFMQ